MMGSKYCCKKRILLPLLLLSFNMDAKIRYKTSKINATTPIIAGVQTMQTGETHADAIILTGLTVYTVGNYVYQNRDKFTIPESGRDNYYEQPTLYDTVDMSANCHLRSKQIRKEEDESPEIIITVRSPEDIKAEIKQIYEGIFGVGEHPNPPRNDDDKSLRLLSFEKSIEHLLKELAKAGAK